MSRKKQRKNTSTEECCIHEDVMKQIHEEHITMRPKTYFIVGAAMQGAGMAGAAILSVFFTNVVIHRLRYDSLFDYLNFGGPGIQTVMKAFPWIPFIVAIGGLVGGSHLLSKYEFSYKHRYIRIFVAFVALIITLGFLLEMTGVNKRMRNMDQFKGIYELEGTRPFVHGRVEYIQGNMVVVTTPYTDEIKVYFESTPEAHIKPGMAIRALGQWDDQEFVIRHVRFYPE